ncbi:amidophosphoribosyltransferase [Selenomonas sp.]|uniref:amidophosphoribosyltransferase n=1 Tax=Selenomonas sp. TaxID=2053611 RepID=UPI001CACD118|nr:amidophosphoribosyltransferase [Selenomonas sp.]MBF1685630.1 amidophosphoribosyltransferase [Selenomonas sp.]MBF1693130.1 amidophosphoribosyltransferase [Selenomonas sp.]MBF1695145.1 amidophosphoribosyltransferase [Selenomonas sp.]MBF1714145.1 amidophosphoribosyltransferase [Selenomonas sp.]
MYEKVPKWKEECGIYGVYSPTEDVSEMTYLGLFALQHRGQESAGIALTDGAWIDVKKGMGLVTEVFRSELPHLDHAQIAIGHVRYATTGFSLAANAQPLRVNYAGGALALAHNGDLTNAAWIRRDLESKGTVFQTTIDSEVFVHLIARSQKATIEERILETAQKVRGAFCLTIMTENKLIGVRDPQGFRPLCIGRTEEGGWVLSSETCALDVNGASFVRDVLPGEMVVVENGALRSYRFTNGQDVASCIFEYIYFARPDSIIDGQSVHAARFEMGRVLARESGLRGDVVISVPDSGTTAATGFAYETGIPFAEGLIKNRYIGRTFIQPTQKQRDTAVKLKLSPVRSVVEGKSVIMVDDSIVRGTTSGKIVRLLRNAGAREIHVCISSPPITDPCYYGIDTSVRKELISATKSLEEIRDFIGADSLHFISIEGLRTCVPALNPDHMCYACFNNQYPVPEEDAALDVGDAITREQQRLAQRERGM